MSTLHQAGRALRAGFGLALGAALAFVSSGKAADAMVSSAPPGAYACFLENGEPGSLVVFIGPFGNNPCAMTATELPGSSRVYCNEGVCPTCKFLQHKWECPLV